MKKTALCILTHGYEEIEALTPIDLLRRADVEVTLASQQNELTLKGRCGVSILAEVLLDAVKDNLFDVLLLPGGPGVKILCEDARVLALTKRHAEQNKIVAAICAAPLIVYRAGVLGSHSFTAHHSVKETLPNLLEHRATVSSGNLITSRGAGTALSFGLEIITALHGRAKSGEIATSIHTM